MYSAVLIYTNSCCCFSLALAAAVPYTTYELEVAEASFTGVSCTKFELEVAETADMFGACVCCRCLASVQSAYHAVEAAAGAHAHTHFADSFLDQAYKLLIVKLRSACQLRLRLVRPCLDIKFCTFLLILGKTFTIMYPLRFVYPFCL